eukprot:jgi/Chlat1/4411/Chrsp29S04543
MATVVVLGRALVGVVAGQGGRVSSPSLLGRARDSSAARQALHFSKRAVEVMDRRLTTISMAALPRLAQGNCALFVCDIQEKFRPVIDKFPAVIHTAKTMLQAANILDVPVLVSEQYPKGLGNIVEELKPLIPEGAPLIEKMDFTMIVPELLSKLRSRREVSQVILIGIEASSCVRQPNHPRPARAGLPSTFASGWRVIPEADRQGCGFTATIQCWRCSLNFRCACIEWTWLIVQTVLFGIKTCVNLHMLAGITTETALFEIMRSASFPGFKEVSKLVREKRPDAMLTYPS